MPFSRQHPKSYPRQASRKHCPALGSRRDICSHHLPRGFIWWPKWPKRSGGLHEIDACHHREFESDAGGGAAFGQRAGLSPAVAAGELRRQSWCFRTKSKSRVIFGHWPDISLAEAQETYREAIAAEGKGACRCATVVVKPALPDRFGEVMVAWLKRDQASNRTVADVEEDFATTSCRDGRTAPSHRSPSAKSSSCWTRLQTGRRRRRGTFTHTCIASFSGALVEHRASERAAWDRQAGGRRKPRARAR